VTAQLERIRAKVAAGLAKAEAAQPSSAPFDRLGLLEALQMAARHGVALPPRMGAEIAEALRRYFASEAATLDSAFGVAALRGQEGPRRARERESRWVGRCVDINILRAMGATLDDAVDMVAQRHGESRSTLRGKYQALRLARDLAEVRALAARWHYTEVGEILYDYPDSIEKERAAARILGRYVPEGVRYVPRPIGWPAGGT